VAKIINEKNLQDIYFDWKQEEEKILHFCWTSKIQLFLELLKIAFPSIAIVSLVWVIIIFNFVPLFWGIILMILFWSIWLFSILYKKYRYKQNYFIITSKRILFHGTNWWFWDYIRKINIEKRVDTNFYTKSIFWRIFKYWTLKVRSETWWIKWEIKIYHLVYGKMISHYIDKLCSLSEEERKVFNSFDPDYFKWWKN